MVLPAPEKMPQAVVEGVTEQQVGEGLVPSSFSRFIYSCGCSR